VTAPMPGAAGAPTTAPAERTLLQDFVTLTKPRIISLLLVTTAVPMYVAGDPSIGTVLLVMLGGYLMAGGANAVNMYHDRDIDDGWRGPSSARSRRGGCMRAWCWPSASGSRRPPPGCSRPS
jgi:hypothetical protein